MSKHWYLKSEKGIKFLKQAIKDKSWDVRDSAVYAAGKIGEKALPILKEVLNDPILTRKEKSKIEDLIEYLENQ